MRQEPRRRGWGGWLIALAILLPLLWIGYWYAVQQAAESAIERLTTQPVAGGRLACVGESLGGFPLRLDLACPKARFSRGADGSADVLAAELGALSASAPLYWPGYVEATLGSPFVVNAPALGLAFTAAWSAAHGTASAGFGGLKAVAANFQSFDFASNGNPRRLPVKAVKATAAAFDLAPAGGNAYRLALAAQGLALVPANGKNLPTLDAALRLTAQDFGSALGADPGGAILTWLRRGGAADVEHVRLTAGGAMLDALGRLTLGPEGLLSGQLQVRFRNPEAFVALAEQLKPGSGQQVMQAMSVLMAVTVPVELPDGPARQTVLNLRNGVVAVGIIPVGSIPALRF